MNDPWETISSEFTSGKKVEGTVIRTLDKGIIFDLGNSIEGIVPMKRIPKTLRSKVKAEYTQDNSFEVIVQEVDSESKKIVLMLDLGEDAIEAQQSSENEKCRYF